MDRQAAVRLPSVPIEAPAMTPARRAMAEVVVPGLAAMLKTTASASPVLAWLAVHVTRSCSAAFPKLQKQIAAEADRLVGADDHASVMALTQLIAFLHEQLTDVTIRRDEILATLLPESPSNRKLAAQLGLSPQRIDQLAKIARGGRPG